MYILEGNIGIGKSTFLTELSRFDPALKCVLEPIDNWAHQDYGKSLLEQFYLAPQRWAYTLETLAMISRSRDHMAIQERTDPHVIERSIYSGHYCFAINGLQSGYFSSLEWDIYSEWVKLLFEYKCQPPRGFIYLRAEPEVCFERIMKRARQGEENITRDYLTDIHNRHEQFLVNKEGVTPALKEVPVLTLNCTEDFLANPDAMLEHAKQIKAFIALHGV